MSRKQTIVGLALFRDFHQKGLISKLLDFFPPTGLGQGGDKDDKIS